MWIRSQDKENLAKANDIEIFNRTDGEAWIYVNDQRYAVYSTEEKALKVLDMIEKLIKEQIRLHNVWQIGVVFPMPQDDEVDCWGNEIDDEVE
ncbi:MAG: hypothetical protein WBK20_07705 [Spirochaetota bacterium]